MAWSELQYRPLHSRSGFVRKPSRKSAGRTDEVWRAILVFSLVIWNLNSALARPLRHPTPAVQSLPTVPLTAPEIVPAELNTSLVAKLGDHAGQRRAGLVCMPNGGFHIRDFISGESAFHELVDQVLNEAKTKAAPLLANRTVLSISLISINSKLCARSWGVFGQGDRVSLTGTARMTFDWLVARSGSTRRENTEIVLDVARSDAASTDQILRMATERLLEVILQGERGFKPSQKTTP